MKYSWKRDAWESFCVLIIIAALPLCAILCNFLLMNEGSRYVFLSTYLVWYFLIDSGRMWKLKTKIAWLIRGVRGYFGGARIHFINSKVRESLQNGDSVIFGCHPHGIFGLSTLINFGIGSQEEGISHVLPDSNPVHVMTLRFSFLLPFWRDLLLALGLRPVDRKSCRSLLRRNHSIAVIVGGAREALFSQPGVQKIILNKRKGIFKLAIDEGKRIVPVFSFGDVDLYDQIVLPWPFSLLQRVVMSFIGFSLPAPIGRFGSLLPFRRKLFTVIGNPIDPTGLTVDGLHAKYSEQLKDLYSKFKHKKDSDLVIV